MAGVVVSRTIPTVILVSSVLQREGVASLLRGTSYKVMAAAAEPSELADYDFTEKGGALAIVGIDSESLDQIAESIHWLRSLIPYSKIVLIGEANRTFDLSSIMALAPDGYILNFDSRDVLVKSLELIFIDHQIVMLGRSIATFANEHGSMRIPKRSASEQDCSEFVTNGHRAQLSQVERQVLICLARGESNKAIALLRHISEATVKVHLKTILRKTNTQNRTQAAIWAIEHGLRDSTLENADPPTHYPKTTIDSPSLPRSTLAPTASPSSPRFSFPRLS